MPPKGQAPLGGIFYGQNRKKTVKKIKSINTFIDKLKKYICYCNNQPIYLKLKGMSPVEYRTHSNAIQYLILSKP